MTRIALGGLHTECSTYSPLLQRAEDFDRLEGDALVAMANVDFAAVGLDPVPIFHDRSIPGGPVAPDVFAAQRAAFVDRLRAEGPFDGALMLMHGAMAVPDVPDPEGVFLCDVRAALGPDAVIAATYDLHGQMTDAVAGALDIFAAYRTAPHIDVAETTMRAARMLAAALHGGPRPSVHWRPIPLLVSGEMSATTAEPCRSLYAALADHDGTLGVEDANLTIGYVWADVMRATAAAVVTATDPDAGRRACDAIADAYWTARHDLTFDMDAAPLGDALAMTGGEPWILADSGDNPTAGGVGDRADALAALLESGRDGALVAGIADPAAHALLAAGEQTVSLGGGLGGGGPRVAVEADAVDMRGDCAVVAAGGIRIVVTARRRPFHRIADFDALGIDLADVDLLIVKSGYLVPEIAALPRRRVMALTSGAVSQDVAALENRHRPRPTWPFDGDDRKDAEV